MRLLSTSVARSALLVASLGALAGCSKTFIPNTDVEDTSDNRKVVQFCEQYRHAVEEKNVGKILSLVSPRYFEDGGNTADEDDLDYEGFKQYLTSSFIKAEAIRYEIRYRHVNFTPTNRVLVDYTYSASWRIPGLKGEEWKHTVADNRLELVPEGESYKVIAGMWAARAPRRVARVRFRLLPRRSPRRRRPASFAPAARATRTRSTSRAP